MVGLFFRGQKPEARIQKPESRSERREGFSGGLVMVGLFFRGQNPESRSERREEFSGDFVKVKPLPETIKNFREARIQ
jgi:hypothetical protein